MNEQPKNYFGLPKSERKLLRKEFNKTVAVKYKVLFALGLVCLLPFLVAVGFLLYYLVRLLMGYSLTYRFYIFTLAFNVLVIAVIFLTVPYNKKFDEWLKERNITRGKIK